MAAVQKAIGGGNLKDKAEMAMLFEYSDDDYNHLDDDNLNKDKKQIKNTDSKKRVKVGHHQGNAIPGGPVEPNYRGMTAANAYEAIKVILMNARNSGMTDGGRGYEPESGHLLMTMTTRGISSLHYIL